MMRVRAGSRMQFWDSVSELAIRPTLAPSKLPYTEKFGHGRYLSAMFPLARDACTLPLHVPMRLYDWQLSSSVCMTGT